MEKVVEISMKRTIGAVLADIKLQSQIERIKFVCAAGDYRSMLIWIEKAKRNRDRTGLAPF